MNCVDAHSQGVASIGRRQRELGRGGTKEVQRDYCSNSQTGVQGPLGVCEVILRDPRTLSSPPLPCASSYSYKCTEGKSEKF